MKLKRAEIDSIPFEYFFRYLKYKYDINCDCIRDISIGSEAQNGFLELDGYAPGFNQFCYIFTY